MTDTPITAIVNTPSAEIASKTFVASTYVPYTGATTNPNIGSYYLIGSGLRANGSGGLLFEANNGTDVLLLGAGGGSGATFYGGVNLNTLTQGSIPFIGSSGLISQDNANLFWDNTNKRLGINTTTPRNAIDIIGGGLRISNSSDDSNDYSLFKTDGTLEIRNNDPYPNEKVLLNLYGPYGSMAFYGTHFTTPNINLADTTSLYLMRGGGNLGIGTYSGSIPAKVNISSTGEQFRSRYDDSNYWNATTGSTGATTFDGAGSAAAFTFAKKVNHSLPTNLKNYTVATLPTGVRGDLCYCTDLLLPTRLGIATGGGAVVGLVFYDGTNWVTY